jgi:serine/threonine protein phosphatase PrpC
MKLNQWAVTRRGRRNENQDAIQTTGHPPLSEEQVCSFQRDIDRDGIVVAVADGVGGQPGGRLASRTGLEELCRAPIAYNGRVALERAIALANERVVALAGPNGRPASTLAGISFGVDRFIAFNIGDTRVYSFHNNRPALLSVDHRSTVDARSITRFLGGSSAQATPQVREVPPETSAFLICSDGFYDFLKTDDLSLPRKLNPSDALQILVEMALANGSHDNLSAVYCSIEE